MAKDRDSTADRERRKTARTAEGVLLVSALAEMVPSVRGIAGIALRGASDGVSALRLLSRSEVSADIGIVIADAVLPDMSGAGFLQRAAALQPLAARVLLLDESEAVPAADRLLALGLADAWPQPTTLEALLQRLLHERAALLRVHHLHRRLEAASSALERLESRFRSVRSAHDQLAASVGAVVGEARDGPTHQRLERWWRDYGDWLELREGRYPIHPVVLHPDQLIAGALGELATSAAGPASEAWVASRPRLPPHSLLRLDAVLARATLVRLLRGLSELAAPYASLGWMPAGTTHRYLRLELRVSALRDRIKERGLVERRPGRAPVPAPDAADRSVGEPADGRVADGAARDVARDAARDASSTAPEYGPGSTAGAAATRITGAAVNHSGRDSVQTTADDATTGFATRVLTQPVPDVTNLELFEDPYARLPDGALAHLSMDLVMAVVLCRAQGGKLRLSVAGQGVVVALDLPLAVAEAKLRAPPGEARRPVVPGGKGVL